ncbi:MAG: energy-coupling factor transporter ATPase [Clostridia bacterium]|nr:energy-coupling factor transporter ATPase [Clostridia bacterium]
MSEYKIALTGVTYRYSPDTPYETRALDNVSVGFESGKITGVIGHTGSGKSTLIQMLNGLLKPDSGEVTLDGADIWANPKKISSVRFKVGMVMQYPEYQLFEETVRKDIAFGPQNMGMNEDEVKKAVEDAAAVVGLTEEQLEKSPFDLSGGQKRRAAIAGIMAMKPEVLVLDEPAAGLDPEGRESILNAVEKYRNETGATVIIVSHSMEDMARRCDNIVVMSHSKIILNGKCDEVFTNSEKLTDAGLDIPQITRLMMLLRSKGVDVDSKIYTVDRAEQALLKLFAEREATR